MQLLQNIRVKAKFLTLLVILTLTSLSTNSVAAQEGYQFSNPSFSGIGWSSHVLTLDQMTQKNQQRLDDKAEALAAEIERELENSNLNKFLRNIESRVYAQISKELVDAIFNGDGNDSGIIEILGNTIEYYNNGDTITLTITNPEGETTTIEVPVGDFGL